MKSEYNNLFDLAEDHNNKQLQSLTDAVQEINTLRKDYTDRAFTYGESKSFYQLLKKNILQTATRIQIYFAPKRWYAIPVKNNKDEVINAGIIEHINHQKERLIQSIEQYHELQLTIIPQIDAQIEAAPVERKANAEKRNFEQCLKIPVKDAAGLHSYLKELRAAEVARAIFALQQQGVLPEVITVSEIVRAINETIKPRTVQNLFQLDDDGFSALDREWRERPDKIQIIENEILKYI